MNELLSPTARTWAEIDMAALKHNYEIARATGKKVMCVIKADAYGHGAVRCGRYLEKCGADAFAVACLSEALELRQGGITKTILILGYTSHEYAKVLADNDITQTLVDESHALELNEAAKAANVTVKGHIKLDTGMSRAGLFAQGHDAAMKAAEAAERMSNSAHTGFAIRNTPASHPLFCRTAGHFLPSAAESNQRTPPKPMVLESFRAWNASRVDTHLPRVPTARSAMPCFRIVSALPSAGRSRGPALPWHIRGAPCVYRADEEPAAPLATYPARGRCPHRPAVYGTPYSVAIAKPVRTQASQSAPSSHPAILPRNNFPLHPPRKGLTGAFFWHTINML